MKGLKADRTEYRKAYFRNYDACGALKDTTNLYARRLMLCYCIECGLKYLILFTKKAFDAEELCEKDQLKMTSHSPEVLLKVLGKQGLFEFQQYKTIHGQTVDSGNYHQCCRYAIKTGKTEGQKEKKLVDELEKIAEWLKGEILGYA